MPKILSNPHQVGIIPEVRNGLMRLGRHIHFDERSKKHPLKVSRRAPLVTKHWPRSVKPFDQGDIGSCTGNGAVGVIASDPFKKARVRYTEALARKVYTEATKNDGIVGSFPPSDTGSTVLAAMKALKALGYVKSYKWCFGTNDALSALSQIGPLELGITWYANFDTPDPRTGRVKVGGEVRGGHAFTVNGIDVEHKLVYAVNSWGTGWGRDGTFCFSWDDLDRLLHEDGEAATVVL